MRVVLVVLAILVVIGLVIWNVRKSLEEKRDLLDRTEQMVNVLYDRITADPKLAPYFVNVNVQAVITHQILIFRSILLEGYTAPEYDLAAIHQHLQIKDSDYTLLEQYIREVFTEFDISEYNIAKTIDTLETFRNEIVRVNDE